MIKKIKLNLSTGTYTVIRSEGSVILTRKETPAMNEFIREAGTPDRVNDTLVYQIRPERKEDAEIH